MWDGAERNELDGRYVWIEGEGCNSDCDAERDGWNGVRLQSNVGRDMVLGWLPAYVKSVRPENTYLELEAMGLSPWPRPWCWECVGSVCVAILDGGITGCSSALLS